MKHFNNEEDARVFVTEIEATIEESVEKKTGTFIAQNNTLATKDDVKLELQKVNLATQQVILEIQKVKGELQVSIEQLRGELKGDIEQLRGEVKEEIQKSKVDIIRWAFVFFVALALMMFSMYLKK